MSHTPGPWKCSGVGAIIALSGEYVASCQPLLDLRGNGRLIAAAPDLLAALKGLFGASQNEMVSRGLPLEWREETPMGRAQAAIAKAEAQ